MAMATTMKRPEILPESVLKAVWTNICDEEFRMKEEYMKGLSRLSWVKRFDIGYYKIYITSSNIVQDEKPLMDELKKIFASNIIDSLVNLIEERTDNDDVESGFHPGPRSEDKHGQTDERKASISGVVADSTGKYYAVTCYHSCFEGKLQGVWAEQHERLKDDYKNGSKACAGSTYEFTDGDKRQRLGKFHCGLYDDKHDIALIEIDQDLNGKNATAHLEEKGIEKTLASKKEVIEKFKEMNGFIPVGKVGRFGAADTKGEMFAIGCSFDKVINYNCYRIRAPEGKVFAERGDAGSLVYMICNGRKIPFAYLTKIHGGFYYCNNLKSSLEALNLSIEPCLVDCGISNRVELVASSGMVDEDEVCRKRPSENVFKIDKKRRTGNTEGIPSDEIPPLNTFNPDEWFKETILDENYDMKAVHVNKLRKKSLSWLKDFSIGVNKDIKSWQMRITYARNTEPCMQDLKNVFGDRIKPFVKFSEESDDEDEYLQGPSSGDTLCLRNNNIKKRGTLTILANQTSNPEDRYAVTCYHVCYCHERLPNDITEIHERLKGDCSNDATGCRKTKCYYIDGNELGEFECGLYDDSNDIALIKLTPGLTLDRAIALLGNGVQSELLSKKEVGNIFERCMKNDKLPTVKKYGAETQETQGELQSITGMKLSDGRNLGFYEIKGTGGDAFAKKGDSGSLVCIIDEDKKLPFAMVCNRTGRAFYCSNLRYSLEALIEKHKKMMNIQPCLNRNDLG